MKVLVKFVKDFNFELSGDDINGNHIDEEQSIKKGTVCELVKDNGAYKIDILNLAIIVPNEYVTEKVYE